MTYHTGLRLTRGELTKVTLKEVRLIQEAPTCLKVHQLVQKELLLFQGLRLRQAVLCLFP